MAMLEGKCPKCGKRYFGWALQFPQNQMCECGTALEITDGNKVTKGYSPFEAEEYVINNKSNKPELAKRKNPKDKSSS